MFKAYVVICWRDQEEKSLWKNNANIFTPNVYVYEIDSTITDQECEVADWQHVCNAKSYTMEYNRYK